MQGQCVVQVEAEVAFQYSVRVTVLGPVANVVHIYDSWGRMF